MAYAPKAKVALERRHQAEHLDILAAMSTAAFAGSGLSEEDVAQGAVKIALEIQKLVAAQTKT